MKNLSLKTQNFKYQKLRNEQNILWNLFIWHGALAITLIEIERKKKKKRLELDNQIKYKDNIVLYFWFSNEVLHYHYLHITDFHHA